MIKAVLWDLGDVLCRFHPDRRVREIARCSGASEDDVRMLLTPELLGRLVAGEITGDELLATTQRPLSRTHSSRRRGRADRSVLRPHSTGEAGRVVVRQRMCGTQRRPNRCASRRRLGCQSQRRREQAFERITTEIPRDSRGSWIESVCSTVDWRVPSIALLLGGTMKFWAVTAFMQSEELIELATMLDVAGYHGVTVSDHIFYPRELKSPYPYSPYPDGRPIWEP